MDGATVVITGAGSGIGRSIAFAAAERGARALVLLDVDEDGMRETERLSSGPPGSLVHRIRLDVTDADAVEAAFEEIQGAHGSIGYLFNSAGIQAGLPAWPDVSAARIRAVIEVNVLGVMFTTRFALPLMKDHGGSILNVASISGLYPYLTGAVYGPSKAAAVHFTKCNKDLADQFGIRVNAICPAMVNTPFLHKTGEEGGGVAPWLAAQIESGQILSPDAVAAAAIRLACDESKAGETEAFTPEDAGRTHA